MVVGTTAGIELGKIIVEHLEELGLAGGVIGVTYVFMLGGIGLFISYTALKSDGSDDSGGGHHEAANEEIDPDDIPDIAKTIQSYNVPPMMTLSGGIQVSLWMILGVAFATGLLSGFLGVGGGFIRMPALFYLIGVPVPIAVGTDLFEIVISGGFGAFTYGLSGGVNLGIVVPLLAGSALGARIGSAATSIVNEDDIKIYFGLMLLGGAVAVAFQQSAGAFGMPILDTVGIILIMLSALLVSGAVIFSTITELRANARSTAPAAD